MARRNPRLTATQRQGPRPDMNWLQVERSAMRPIANLIATHPPAAQLLLVVMNLMEPGTGGIVVASRTALCELTGFSISTFHRALKPLIEQGWIQRVKIGNAFAIAVNSHIAWIGSRDKLQHAHFTATVIASATEQDQWALNPPETQFAPVALAKIKPGSAE